MIRSNAALSFIPADAAGSLAAMVGRTAVRALYAELALHPKPGLVSPLDSGSHDDMDMGTFLRSLFALRGYFRAIAAAGAAGEDFATLRDFGIAAERRMLAATGGINTHRGAVFGIGFLGAAAGWRMRRGLTLRGAALGGTVAELWGAGILAAAPQAPVSHGGRAVERYGVRGARQEAAEGFPTLFTLALPALDGALTDGADPERALVQTLFTLMAELEDTNLLHRGGPAGLAFVRGEARRFLDRGGVFRADWREEALALHRACIARRLSPGGSADMLAAAHFVHALREGWA
ncbi:triphosphoribosyl-dephospho-CoA synthase [Azospirillum lipoferum]|uniref:Probable 2-(5''-triphosphoribosyl)-3'-dephosphocoenzyme-A synthase n=1 Tax=Azospirillum lipoferum TaxID=193 RepID=A0A5A9GPF7_AZOLI|nr:MULTISPECIES: triphosphoribosyl-dephospho-CoA synthase MdcB [Azospirillum]KAA0596230.1 triphosphoribosyl-dephospho-CoA synthase MdcB [Azospirillum lipoferum]MCP1611195.1 triphosphoribosyl-dephospho-CoA synthase [Azospirillum lipoferum]MDW5533680.1 triphosphoribosyl-dephospho-CoA synthase MdcB [Azospirillum sp. NL1]